MSGKRAATTDLNHDNWDQEEEPEEAGTFAVASAEELKGRVIKKAKRRGVKKDGSGGLFSSFGGFGAGTAADGAAAGSGMFDFLKSAPAKPPEEPSSKETKESSGPPPKEPAKSSTGAGLNSPAKTPAPSGFAGTLVGKANGGATKWTCDTCMVPNDADKLACACCETPKPGAAPPKKGPAAATPTPTSNGAAKESGFAGFAGTLVGKSNGAGSKWTCDTCMVSNDADKQACVCCESVKPGTAPPAKKNDQAGASSSSVGANGFKFGGASASAPGSGFSFGSDSAKSAVAAGGGVAAGTGFKFGSQEKPSKSEGNPSGFRFGGGAAPATTGFTFGGAGGSTDKAPSSSAGFVFGKSPAAAEPVPSNGAKGGLSKLGALNCQFLAWIKKAVDGDPEVLLTPAFADYASHLKDIEAEGGGGSKVETGDGAPTFAFSAAAKPTTAGNSGNGSASSPKSNEGNGKVKTAV